MQIVVGTAELECTRALEAFGFVPNGDAKLVTQYVVIEQWCPDCHRRENFRSPSQILNCHK